MRTALALCLAVVLGGCFQFTSVLTVRPDGSATLREDLTLSGMGLMALAEEADDGDPWADLDLEGRAAALGEGVRLASFEPAEDGFTAVYDVDDVGALTYSMEEGFGSAGGTGGPSYRFAFDGSADGLATLRVLVPKSDAKPATPPTEDAEAERAEAEQMLTLMRGFFEDARLTIAVEVDGEITETTAAHVEGPRVTLFELPFAPFLEAALENPAWMQGGGPDPAALYEELSGVEGVRVEGPGTVRVRFH